MREVDLIKAPLGNYVGIMNEDNIVLHLAEEKDVTPDNFYATDLRLVRKGIDNILFADGNIETVVINGKRLQIGYLNDDESYRIDEYRIKSRLVVGDDLKKYEKISLVIGGKAIYASIPREQYLEKMKIPSKH